jgi:thioredoxin 1
MRLWKLLLAAGLVVATVPVSRPAAGAIPFTEEAFEASQRQGKRILVQITASWSPVCVRQRRIVGLLQEEPRFKDLMVYTIDFDARKDLVREMGAQEQSTLIVFKGVVEIGRSTGENDPAAIESLLAKSAE